MCSISFKRYEEVVNPITKLISQCLSIYNPYNLSLQYAARCFLLNVYMIHERYKPRVNRGTTKSCKNEFVNIFFFWQCTSLVHQLQHFLETHMPEINWLIVKMHHFTIITTKNHGHLTIWDGLSLLNSLHRTQDQGDHYGSTI